MEYAFDIVPLLWVRSAMGKAGMWVLSCANGLTTVT